MANENNTSPSPANVANPLGNIPDIHVDVGGALDMDDMRSLSAYEYEKEHGKEDQIDYSNLEVEKVFGDDEESEDKPTTEVEDKDESPESDEDEEEDEESEAEEPADEAQDGTGKPSKSIKVKTKDGKEIEIPRDAKFPIKVDGKIEELSAQDVVDLASGNRFIAQEVTKLSQERTTLEQQTRAFTEQADTVKENMEILQKLSQEGSPEDVIEYWALLSGKDPEQLLAGWVQNAVTYAQQLSQMTDRERQLFNQNRRFRFQQLLLKRQNDKTQKEQSLSQEKVQVETTLKKHGLDWPEWRKAADEISKKIEAGEITRVMSALDVAEYASQMQHENLVRSAIERVDKSLLTDRDFYQKISKAVIREESLGDERLTLKEVARLVKRKLEKDKARINENLNKKAEVVKKANSKKAGSDKQEKDDVGPASIAEHRERVWGTLV